MSERSREQGCLPDLLLCATLLLIFAVTLHARPGVEPESGILCFPCSRRAVLVVPLNVLLFMPLGVALALRGWPMGRAVLTGILLSVTIETFQLWIPGRHSALLDVFANGTGALLGALGVHLPRRSSLRWGRGSPLRERTRSGTRS